MAELYEVISALSQEKTLDMRYRDHALIGNWAAHRECHIASDWLLIYRMSEGILYLERTGTHSELFNK